MLAGWLAGWLIDWPFFYWLTNGYIHITLLIYFYLKVFIFIHLVIHSFVRSLIHSFKSFATWLAGLLHGWLVDWLTDWLIDWLINWLIDWLIDWFQYLEDSNMAILRVLHCHVLPRITFNHDNIKKVEKARQLQARNIQRLTDKLEAKCFVCNIV